MKLQEISPENDLHHIFTKHPEHVNTEYVYAAKTNNTPIYIDPGCAANKKIKVFLEHHLVSIITPNMLHKLRDATKENIIDILQSSYENGRVLTIYEKIVINDIPYSVVLKWIWSTAYARETGAINPWMRGDIYIHKEEEKQALADFPFYESSWVYWEEKALLELERSQMLHNMWIHSEKVLAIYKLEEIIWPNGNYISIQELEETGVITQWKKPVILIRAHKTNFRLLDIIMLDKYERNQSIPNLIEHILCEAETQWWTKDINQYTQKLFTTVIKNRLDLSWKFSRLNGEFWQDICRNISMFWEELDLGTMDPMKDDTYFRNPNFYLEHYKRNMQSIFIWFSQMISTLEENSEYKIDHEELAKQVYNTVVQWVIDNKEDTTELYEKYNWGKWFWFSEVNAFLRSLIRESLKFFTDYSNKCEYEKILREKIEEKFW